MDPRFHTSLSTLEWSIVSVSVRLLDFKSWSVSLVNGDVDIVSMASSTSGRSLKSNNLRYN